MTRRLQESIATLQHSFNQLHAHYTIESLQLLKNELFEKVVKTHFTTAGNFQFFASSTTVSSTVTADTTSQVSSQDTDALYALHEQYYWPTFCFIQDRFLRFRQAHSHNSIPSSSGASSSSKSETYPPFLVGVSAPQGCGKTTMTELMTKFFKYQSRSSRDGLENVRDNKKSFNCIAMSLDDFYLKGVDQDQLAAEYPDNPLLQFRGNAGTHDMSLIQQTLRDVHAFNLTITQTPQATMAIPRYSKALRQGRGDRSPPSEWTTITEPVDIVLFEGWMLGFSAHKKEVDLQQAITEARRDFPGLPSDVYLTQLNSKLDDYEVFHRQMNAWLILALDGVQSNNSIAEHRQNYDVVYTWRMQAETAMKNKQVREGLPVSYLSEAQVKDFVDRFMPAYYLYLSKLYQHGPAAVQSLVGEDVSVLKVSIDELRKPRSYELLS